MVEKAPIRVQHKRMTKSEWASSPVILLQGEIGVESDTGLIKVGDGKKRFKLLTYANSDVTRSEFEALKAEVERLKTAGTSSSEPAVENAGIVIKDKNASYVLTVEQASYLKLLIDQARTLVKINKVLAQTTFGAETGVKSLSSIDAFRSSKANTIASAYLQTVNQRPMTQKVTQAISEVS